MLEQTVHDPVFGVGFGQPTRFRWNGILYDARTGNSADPNDVTGPHNSIVNILYRTGLLGLIPLLILVAIGIVRLVRGLRSPRLSRLERATLLATAAIFAFVVVTSAFWVALEGPFMGIFFWVFLGLMLTLPTLFGASDPEPGPSGSSV